MKDHTDDWIENRILWALKKNGLPGLHSHLFKEPATRFPNELQENAASGTIGRPVLVFLGNDNQWTLLGTEGVTSYNLTGHWEVRLDDIKEVSVQNPNLPKESQEYLSITDSKGHGHLIWGPPRAEFLVLWSILSMLLKLRK